MTNRLPPAFSKHLKRTAKPSVDQAAGQKQEEEAVRLAMTLHMQGRSSEAEQLCLKILSRNPGNAKALYVAGKIALEAEDFSLAERRFERAVKESPREPLFLVALGEASGTDHEAAIKHYQKALSIRPNMIEAMSGLGRAYARTGRAEAALGVFEKVLRLDPEHRTVRIDLAGALTSLGRMDEASAVLRESIRLRKAVGAAYGALAGTQKFSGEPPELNEILRELEREKVNSGKAARLHHAAGKILDDLKRHEEAFDQFQKGNRASGVGFDLDAYRQTVDGAIEGFSPEFFRSKAGFGDDTDVPVFILGMPRSGTTLTEQICSSHPAVFGGGELRSLRRVVRRSGFGENSLAEFHSALAAITPEKSLRMAADYLSDVLKLAPRATRITDKMPHNFELIGFIAVLFPRARIIHCRRDPIDTCISCFTTSFSDKHGYNADLTTLGLYYREYDRLMRHWNSVQPGRIHECRYEALIADQEAESRRLIEFLGLPWDDACLRFEENDRVVNTASKWQVRQPIYKTSVKRWKSYEHKIQPLIEALGDLAEV